MVFHCTSIKESSPLAPLDISPEGETGPNPRLAKGIAPKSRYLTLYALVLTMLMFAKMTFGTVEGAGKLSASEYLEGLIADVNSDTVDFVTSCVRAGGVNAELDVATRTPGNFDLVRDLLEERAKVLAKTDCLPWYCNGAQKRTSYFYNRFPGRLVGNYGNLVCAQPVKD